MTGLEKQKALTILKKECLACRSCEIGEEVVDGFRPQVFSRGNVNAPIALVGQNPGRTEIEMCMPFVGDAGKFLDKMLATLELEARHIYVTNSVKCFTPKNRAPTNSELTTCRQFLKKELETLKPKLIITLGNPALETVLGYTGITVHRGQIKRSEEFDCDVMPLLHPASTLHNRTKYLPMMEEDLETLKNIIHQYL